MINRRETLAPVPEREVSYTRPFNDEHVLADSPHIFTLPQSSSPSRSTSPPNPQRSKEIFHKLLHNRSESPQLVQHVSRPSSGLTKNHFICLVPASTNSDDGDKYFFVVDRSSITRTSMNDSLPPSSSSNSSSDTTPSCSLCANTSRSRPPPTLGEQGASPPIRPQTSVRMASFSVITSAGDEKSQHSIRNNSVFMLPHSGSQNIDRDEPTLAVPQASYNRSFNRSLNSTTTLSRSGRSIDPEMRKSIVSLVMSFSSIATSSSSSASQAPSIHTPQQHMDDSQDDTCRPNNRCSIDDEFSVAHAQKIIESAGGKAKFIQEMRSLYSGL